MALAPCRECKKPVSTEAKTCPSCGVANPTVRPTSGLVKGALVLVGAIVVAAGLNSMKDPPPPPPTPPAPRLDPVADAAKAKKNAAFQTVVGALLVIKKSAREPDSIQFDKILANDEATLICVQYRGRNGFGGMSVEHIGFDRTGAFKDSASWNKKCAGKPLNDFASAVHAL